YRASYSTPLQLHDTGPYELVVYGAGDAIGNYSFEMVRPIVTATPLAFDTPVTGTIDKPGDERIYTFAGTSGDRLYLDGLSGSGGDTRYSLVSPTGEYLVNNQYRDSNSPPL